MTETIKPTESPRTAPRRTGVLAFLCALVVGVPLAVATAPAASAAVSIDWETRASGLAAPTHPHPEQNSNHFGGQLAFDTSGPLFMSTGDGGGGGDPDGNGQDRSSLQGKLQLWAVTYDGDLLEMRAS